MLVRPDGSKRETEEFRKPIGTGECAAVPFIGNIMKCFYRHAARYKRKKKNMW